MFRRFLLLLVIAWAAGFLWFALQMPGAAGEKETDGVIVLTGGEGRIARGLTVVRKGWASKMLVSGVDKEVKPHEFQKEYKVPDRLMQCCITLGFQSIDTRSNAREAARWIASNRFKSIRLVTTDWHMRRAAYELDQMRPDGVTILRDSVPSNAGWRTLFTEYNKLLARRAAWLWGS